MTTVGAAKPLGPAPSTERIEALVLGAIVFEEFRETDAFLKLDFISSHDEYLCSLTLDLNDSNSIAQAIAATLTLTGGELYALFNNGAYGQPGAVEDLSRAVLRQQFETNFFGWCELTNTLLPTMLRPHHSK